MSAESDQATRYRERAEEMRAIANGCKEPDNADRLMQVAHDYEQMARTMDTIDATNRALLRY